MNYLKVIFIVCLMSYLCTGCVLVGSESEESPFYDMERRLDRETPAPIRISDDRIFFLC